MFPLCSACADMMNQGNCTHTNEKRCVVVTWVVDEVSKAVEMGYGLMDVLEFGEYKVTCFDRGTKSGGLFPEYVNMFLKLKQESSGYPSWVQSETKTNTSRTTGAQRKLLWTRRRFKNVRF